MPIIIPILQVFALSLCGSSQDPMTNAILTAYLSSPSPKSGLRSTSYFSSDSAYFVNSTWSPYTLNAYNDQTSTWTIYDHGYFALFVLFDYLDRKITDDVVSESNDWISVMANPNSFNSHPTGAGLYLAAADLGTLNNNKQSLFSYVTSFLSNAGLTYNPSLNSASYFEYNDDYFWKNAVRQYLIGRGFTEDISENPDDFSVVYGRQGIWYEYSGGTMTTQIASLQAQNLISAVNNDLPAIFTVSISSTQNYIYPFFCYGYEEYTFGGMNYYDFYGFSPYHGPLVFSETDLATATVVNLHVSHTHSNNIVADSNGFAFCTCGTRTCYEVHDYHYQRLNATYHRKTCSICGDTSIEAHSGLFCICMLGDL